MAHRPRRGDRPVARGTTQRAGLNPSASAVQRRDGRPSGRPRGAGTAIDLSVRVLYRDRQIIVIDKPAGLPVHGGARARGPPPTPVGGPGVWPPARAAPP